MAMLVYGPSKTAKIQFVLSVQETSAIGFLANWFCSQDEIDQIKANNAIKDTDEITDAGLVNIDTEAQDPETPDIEIVDVKGATYSGKLMIVKDPSRLFVGTVPEFTNGNGMVVADIAKRYDAIGGVNGGEFVDGETTYTAMPIGLVMKDEEIQHHAADSLFGFYLRKKNYAKAEKYLDYFSEHDPMKSYYQGRLLQEQGKIKEAYEKYENVIFSGFSTLNFVLSTMAGLALRENDIGYARFLSGKVQAVAHTLEMGKYNEYSPMLDIVCAGKDVEGTYKVVKHLLDNVGTMYDFRKSDLYKHMKFRDIDEAILDSVKEKLLEGFRNEEEFGYMTGYEPWEKLIFDR